MKHELRPALGLHYVQISSISNLAALQVLWPRRQRGEQLVLSRNQPAEGSTLLQARSRERSTKHVLGRTEAMVLLNEEDCPREQTEQDVLGSFTQALCPSE